MIYFGRSSLWTALLLWLWLDNNVTGADDNYSNNGVNEKKNTPHSRQKRLLWITTDGRLALPPGTRLTITPSLSLPFVRYPPDGFLSNMSISLPFTSQCDDFYTLIYYLFIYLLVTLVTSIEIQTKTSGTLYLRRYRLIIIIIQN